MGPQLIARPPLSSIHAEDKIKYAGWFDDEEEEDDVQEDAGEEEEGDGEEEEEDIDLMDSDEEPQVRCMEHLVVL